MPPGDGRPISERTGEEPGSEQDAEAIAAFKAGRREAFGQLVERHRNRIFGLAMKLTGSAEDAADVTQDTFVKALCKVSALENPRYFGTWLYRIAINTAISALRKHGRGETAEDPQILEQVSGEQVRLPTPVMALSEKERGELISQALAELPEAQRVAVALCDLEGQTYEAIATLLDISKGTVMSRIHYGRKKLREKLGRKLDR